MISIVGVYAPNEDALINEKDDFYNQLGQFFRKSEHGEKLSCWDI